MAKRKSRQPTDWNEATDRFIAHLEADEKSRLTRRNYRDDLTMFDAWYHKHYQEAPGLGRLGATELREFKAHLIERDLKPATINRKLAALRSFCRWAEAAGLAGAIQAPKTIRQERPLPRWLSRSEELALLRAVETAADTRDLAIIKVLLYAGLRIAELAALKWSDITITDRKGNLMVRWGKGAKWRDVPLNVEARKALINLGGREWIGKDRSVFWGQRGAMTVRGLQEIVESYGKAAGLFDLTPHVLRHTFCHNLALKGVRLEEIAKLAGHESIETTRRYCEPGQDALEDAVEKLVGSD
jgi:integrase/recombinase XerC